MRLRIKYNLKTKWLGRRIMGGFRGKVLYPFMLFAYPRNDVSDSLFRHELEHVDQVRRDGWLHFYIKYLYWLWKYGYAKLPYEMDAREAAKLPLTDDERDLKESNGDDSTGNSLW